MNITGLKVCVRDRIPNDSVMETVWILDREVLAVDPSAGKTYNSQRFSIETLNGKHIGSCSLYNQTLIDVQLGIRIGDRDYWNKGCGTEAVNILVHYWRHMMDVECIWLKVLLTNTRAIRCYSKCGFVRTGQLALDGYDFARMEIRRT